MKSRKRGVRPSAIPASLLAADGHAVSPGEPSLSDRFTIELTPLAQEGFSVEGLLSTIHSTGIELSPVMEFSVFEVVPDPPKPNGRLESRDPFQYSLEDFSANVRERMAKL